MRNLIKLSALAAGLGAALWTIPASAEVKIGSIRAAEVVRESPLYKSAEEKMRGEFEKRQKEMEEQGKKLAADIEKFKKEADLISADERAKREKDLTTRRIDMGAAERKFRDDFASRDRELTQDLMSKVKDVIQQVATEKGLELIVQDPVYAAPGIDITAEVLKRLSAQSAAAAPAKKK
ncbi:MAG: OmpH family outer membrane protein [Gammaproteobacteria bacterium]|nr:OmpH family outer membrane protein [Gammaproteobacteria bacterium]